MSARELQCDHTARMAAVNWTARNLESFQSRLQCVSCIADPQATLPQWVRITHARNVKGEHSVIGLQLMQERQLRPGRRHRRMEQYDRWPLSGSIVVHATPVDADEAPADRARDGRAVQGGSVRHAVANAGG